MGEVPPISEGRARRTQLVRAEAQRLLRQVPFHPFAANMENGDRLIIGHPEHIAFDPAADHSEGSADFYVIAGDLRVFGTFATAINCWEGRLPDVV